MKFYPNAITGYMMKSLCESFGDFGKTMPSRTLDQGITRSDPVDAPFLKGKFAHFESGRIRYNTEASIPPAWLLKSHHLIAAIRAGKCISSPVDCAALHSGARIIECMS